MWTNRLFTLIIMNCNPSLMYAILKCQFLDFIWRKRFKSAGGGGGGHDY